MNHPTIERWATLLTDYCLEVQAGQNVMLNSSTLALPLVRAVHNAILQRGAWPVMRLSYPGQTEDFFEHASDAQLDTLPALTTLEFEHCDAFLRIGAEHNTRAMAETDPNRQMRYRRTIGPSNKIRLAKKWCITLYPTEASAQDAGMNLAQFEHFVFGAMFLDRPDPVMAWREIHELQAQLIERLTRARTIKLESDGTDLSLQVTDRTWRNSDGKRNMPSGEVFTGPLEESAHGSVRFDVPSSVQGHDVSNVTLSFKAGLVTHAKAETGDQFLQASLETDPGARRLGEIGIGTNAGIQRAIKNILFDEKIGGTVHLALGSSYPETGGTNQSALHWDLILDMRKGGRILLDGEVFQENGKFV